MRYGNHNKRNKYAGRPGQAQPSKGPYKFTCVPKQHGNKVRPKQILNESMLSDEQMKVFESICDWYEQHRQGGLLTLGGYAGTGKSTLVSLLAGRYQQKRMGFAAFTGKATSVLRRKLLDASLWVGESSVTTLHKLLYRPVVDEEHGSVSGWVPRERPELDLIIVDEASMVSQRLYDSLMAYDIPLLAVGDHGQLPPVFGGSFNLMQDPILRLETIHRQAKGSPILALSEEVRRSGIVRPPITPQAEVQVVDISLLGEVIDALFGANRRYEDVAILTNTNRERNALNNRARRAKWGAQYSEELKVGDVVICLRNVEGSIFNGMRGIVTQLSARRETALQYYARILFEDDEIMVEGPVCKAQFGCETTIKDFPDFNAITGQWISDWDDIGLLFDYGYALTVHKAQGSQFTYCVVVNRPTGYMDFGTKKRALYTAITRASKYLIVLQ